MLTCLIIIIGVYTVIIAYGRSDSVASINFSPQYGAATIREPRLYNIRERRIFHSVSARGCGYNLQRDTGALFSWVWDHPALAQVWLLFKSGVY